MDDAALSAIDPELRAAEAAALLDNWLLKEAVASIEAALLQGWRDSPARDTEARERLWHQQRALTQILDYLRSVVETGVMVRKQAEEAQAAREFEKAYYTPGSQLNRAHN